MSSLHATSTCKAIPLPPPPPAPRLLLLRLFVGIRSQYPGGQGLQNFSAPSTVHVISPNIQNVPQSQQQAMFRALVARRETRAIRTERDEIKRRQLEQIRAAVVLQAGARARAARLLVAGKRQAIWNAARQEQGSLIIQVPAHENCGRI